MGGERRHKGELRWWMTAAYAADESGVHEQQEDERVEPPIAAAIFGSWNRSSVLNPTLMTAVAHTLFISLDLG